MSNDILSPALIASMVGNLSVPDLIRTMETFKQSGQTASIEAGYAAWIAQNQGHPLLYAVLFNYSVCLSDVGKLDEAQQQLEKAIAINPDFMPPYINLGRIYERQGKIGLAIIQWSAGLTKMSAITGMGITHKTTALNQSARALEAISQDESAELMLRESLELDPHQSEVAQHLIALRQRQYEWPVVLPTDRVDRRCLMQGMSPLSAAAYTDDPMLQLALSSHYNITDVGTPPQIFEAWPKATEHNGPLRIGYLSSDLREHAVGYLMTEILGLHDRSKVEVFAYYCGPATQDQLQQHFHTTADHWASLSDMDDNAAAQRIADDGIQILVDVNGYTREARLKVVAQRPAPVIVNWLGYPGTMASPYHHYIVADDWIIPESHETYYSEKVLRLPCYQPNNRNRALSPVQPSRTEAGLPDDATVYCCFNGSHKIHRATFERWMRILAQVPGSVLWLLDGSETTNKRLREHAALLGITEDRIIFAPKVANASHLVRYPLADLFLDTTPYGAHTTASDALWMGVPVLTCSGRSFASRVCGSLVRSAGTPEMVCENLDDYVQKAVELGNNKAQLKTVREKLANARKTCTLFDMPLLVSSLEALYEQMWADCKQGNTPRPDLAQLETYLEVGIELNHEEVEVQAIADYKGWWTERLARRHKLRPMSMDKRMATDPKLFG